MKDKVKKIKFTATESTGVVSGLLLMPAKPSALYLFAHGAGAPMTHPFMEKQSSYLAEQGIGTFRYNFPYTEKNQKRIDPAPVLMKTVRSAVNEAKRLAQDVPLFAGGKSMGGRMTSQAASSELPDGVKGLIFFGFPLHAPGKLSSERGEHLKEINIPMLFIQGTRDKLADLKLIEALILKIGSKAHLHIIQGADHSFHVLKSSGRSDEDVLKENAGAVKDWINSF